MLGALCVNKNKTMKLRLELDFNSLIILVVTVSIAAGILWGTLTGFYYIVTGEMMLGLMMPFAIPLVFAFQGLITVLLGFPLYRWFCRKYRGQSLTGVFEVEQE